VSNVYLRHQDLPDEQWIEVPAESRVHYSPAGWQLVPDEDVAERAADAAHAVATAEARMAGHPLPPRPATPNPPKVAAAEQAQDDSAGDSTSASDAKTTTAPAASKRSK
jgi:hypothetical protein